MNFPLCLILVSQSGSMMKGYGSLKPSVLLCLALIDSNYGGGQIEISFTVVLSVCYDGHGTYEISI